MSGTGRVQSPHEQAKEPCEHGMRYRGTGRVCGYCLAVYEQIERRLNDYNESEQP